MDVHGQFPSLEEVLVNGRRAPRKSAFLILLTKDFTVSVDPKGGRTLKLSLHSKLPVLLTTQQKQGFHQRCAPDRTATEYVAGLETPGEHPYKGEFPFRWASAGCLPVFVISGCRYVMLFLRDLRPIVGWNVANGASNTLDEMWQVEDLAERESKEEILVLQRTPAGEVWRRLEMPRGRIQQVDSHTRVLRRLGRSPRIEMNPILGRVDYNAPDRVEVRASWAAKQTPAITNNGFVIFNPENGENGIEFIQLVEWEIKDGDRDVPVRDLVFFDAEVSEDAGLVEGKDRGAPLQQAVGLFPIEALVAEFQKDHPRPAPKYVFDRGTLLCGDELADWMQKRPFASQWCPVARKVLRRYFDHTLGTANSFVKSADNTWTITFEGRSHHYPDRVGCMYLAHLVQHQGEIIPSQVLDRVAHPADPGREAEPGDEGRLREQGLSTDRRGSHQPLLDERAVRALKAEHEKLRVTIDELEKDLEQAMEAGNGTRAAELQRDLKDRESQFETLRGRIRADLGLRGRPRAFRDAPEERIRSAVTKALTRVIKEIGEVDPRLAGHLQSSINTGGACSYQPPTPMRWYVQAR
jgi:hypothetical protein